MEEEHEIETQIQLIKTTLQPTTGGQRSSYTGHSIGKPAPRPVTRAFMATHGESNGNEHIDMEYDPLMEQYHLMEAWMKDTPATMCFMSPAESTLRTASGTQQPIECWGCTGHGRYHNNRYHSFRDCPNKFDPEVRQTAFRRMKQMREEWETRKSESEDNKRKRDGSTLMAKAEVLRDWRKLGFHTKRDAERAADAAALMAVDISNKTRQHLVRAWNRKWQKDDMPTEATTEREDHTNHNSTTYSYYGPSEDANKTGVQRAYNLIVRVFQAVPVRLPLEISPTLPHCQIPIGDQHGKGKLTVALDSCAGVNIGYLAFHKGMAEVFPEMIASFKSMEEYGEKDINIGGVEVSATNLKITHIVEYRTPFRYNGAPCNLTFGLSEHAAATAILSINFLCKTKALWSYDDSEPNVHLTIWNTTLKIHYETPTRREAPTPQARFRNGTW